MSTRPAHTWTFFRAGGLDQVLIEKASDLLHLHELDPKLWVALSCPVKGLEFDTKTLELLDTDKDGRVRVPELLAALKWTCGLLKDPAQLLKSATDLPLAAINDGTDEGKSLLASARQILINLQKPDATAISVAETSNTVSIFSETVFNGDGVVQTGCAKDDATKLVIDNIIGLLGADNDRSGKPGVGKDKLTTFFTAAREYQAWWSAGEEASRPGSGVLPLGEDTPAAFSAFTAVKAKINDWFTRCRLADYDGRATGHLNRAEADYDQLALQDLSLAADAISALPLQQVAAQAILALDARINPAWVARIADFRTHVVVPLLGNTAELSAQAWADLCGRFAAYETWFAGKQGALVEPLGIARVREILASSAEADILALIENDLAVAPHVAAIESVDRLVRYHRDLVLLLKNFLNFADFYDRMPPPPIFMCGTLYLDQRSCDLCIQVADAAAHSTLAAMGKVFIAYLSCTRPIVGGGIEKMIVAAAVTQGDSDYLMVGRNGLFYDRKGRDWDATIIKIIDHPISIQQAFWSPYKKIGKMISDTIEKIAGDADKAAMDKANASVSATATATTAGTPAAKPKIDTGMLAAIGIAASALVSGIGTVAATIFGLPLWKIPLVFIGIMLAISGPAMIIAFLKLRQRTLGPILEANGWAINGRVKINLPLGNSLTTVKRLPLGSKRMLDDPFEDKVAKRRFRLTLVAVILFAVCGGICWLTWNSYSNYHQNPRFWETWGTDTPKQSRAKKLDSIAKELEARAAKPDATAELKLEAKDARTKADKALIASGLESPDAEVAAPAP
jgi:hypothetical protein